MDVSLLRDIVEYIEEFPDKIHHPKEERYIFRACVNAVPRPARCSTGSTANTWKKTR